MTIGRMLMIITLLGMMSCMATTANAQSEPQFRAAWKSALTGDMNYDSWTDKNTAFARAWQNAMEFPYLEHSVQMERRKLGVPLAPKTIPVASVARKPKSAGTFNKIALDGIYGEVNLFVDGTGIHVSSIATDGYPR